MLLVRIYITVHLNFRCNETEQFKEYEEINKRLFKANDNEIFEWTGCLSKCDKNAYHATPMGGMTPYHGTLFRGHNVLLAHIYYSSVEHELREQVNLRTVVVLRTPMEIFFFST